MMWLLLKYSMWMVIIPGLLGLCFTFYVFELWGWLILYSVFTCWASYEITKQFIKELRELKLLNVQSEKKL